jgi:hypothetical protein
MAGSVWFTQRTQHSTFLGTRQLYDTWIAFPRFLQVMWLRMWGQELESSNFLCWFTRLVVHVMTVCRESMVYGLFLLTTLLKMANYQHQPHPSPLYLHVPVFFAQEAQRSPEPVWAFYTKQNFVSTENRTLFLWWSNSLRRLLVDLLAEFMLVSASLFGKNNVLETSLYSCFRAWGSSFYLV